MNDAIADIPKCVMGDIGMEITGEDAPPVVEALNDYLSRFAAPICKDGNGATTYRCLNCDRDLSGLLGSFQWDIASGEGKCSNCGWPCRAHHYPKDATGDIFDRALEVILQYHPNNVTHKDDADDASA